MDQMWKVKEVAALLRVNTKTVYTWVASGGVDHVRIPGGGIRIPAKEVSRLYGDPEPCSPTSPATPLTDGVGDKV